MEKQEKEIENLKKTQKVYGYVFSSEASISVNLNSLLILILLDIPLKLKSNGMGGGGGGVCITDNKRGMFLVSRGRI